MRPGTRIALLCAVVLAAESAWLLSRIPEDGSDRLAAAEPRLDTLARDLRYTFRSLRRTPVVSLTIVATVALGLGLVTVVFTLLNSFIFRVDEVRNPHEMFEVERQQSERVTPDRFTRAEFDALLRETGVFTSAYARMPDIDAWVEGRRMEAALVTGNFFRVLGVDAARGRTFTPADDQPGGRPIIVLSHRAWSRHFGADPGVLSRPIVLNGGQFRVAGVMPDGFRGLAVADLVATGGGRQPAPAASGSPGMRGVFHRAPSIRTAGPRTLAFAGRGGQGAGRPRPDAYAHGRLCAHSSSAIFDATQVATGA